MPGGTTLGTIPGLTRSMTPGLLLPGTAHVAIMQAGTAPIMAVGTAVGDGASVGTMDLITAGTGLAITIIIIIPAMSIRAVAAVLSDTVAVGHWPMAVGVVTQAVRLTLPAVALQHVVASTLTAVPLPVAVLRATAVAARSPVVRQL